MNRRWICSDVLMDIFPFFDRAQLGLKLALLSPRFDVLVDKHFAGKSEWTVWRTITIYKDIVANMPVFIDKDNSVKFELPDRLSNKIRFVGLRICYIDHFFVAFLRANQQIWDKGTDLHLWLSSNGTNNQLNWDVFVREIWPIFAPNIRQLDLAVTHLDNLRRRISPTILTDHDQLNSIQSINLFPDAIADDGPNSTAGQALSKWLHTPRKDGQPKRLNCSEYYDPSIKIDQWIKNLKKAFSRATTCANFIIHFEFHKSTAIELFELVNERTREKLTLEEGPNYPFWLLKRCPIGQMIQLEDGKSDKLNKLIIDLNGGKKCIGPLSPPAAGQNNE